MSTTPTILSRYNEWQSRPTPCVHEAVNRAVKILNPTEMEAIRNTSFERLTEFHYCVGARIRNHLGLWSENQELVKRLTGGASCADLASRVILEKIWENVQNSRV